MTRAIIFIAVLCSLAGGIYWAGGSEERATTIKREKEISDAIKDSDSAPSWRDQLLGRE
ncbi:hypothetical protein [Sulfitobacter sp.]|uniref:hypothetical protein n=1 Tax=Sulfitobacter sp. TaxID=1903071 RepID=UPI0030027C11